MPDKNAAAHRVYANAMTLRELGYEVFFIGPTKNRTSVVTEFNGFSCEYIDYPKTVYQWLKYITKFISINEILKYSPDYVILYNFPAIASLRILRACHRKGIKVIHDITEWESSKGCSLREVVRKIDINLRMFYCVKKMDGVIAISRYLYNYYSRYTTTIMVPPTVDLKNPKFERNRQLTANNPVQLVYAGSIGAGNKERLDDIIKIVADMKSVAITIVGLTAEQYEKVYGYLPSNCDNVKFIGRVSHREAIKIVCNSDFQVLIRENTIKNKAGFPTKFVESMSCSVPIIATVTSNICDYIFDGKNGFIVDDKSSLRNVLERVGNLSAAEIIAMKVECRNFYGFDYNNFKGEFSKIFN